MLATNYTRHSRCVDISSSLSSSSVYSVRPKFNIKSYHYKPTKFGINYSHIDNAVKPKRFKIRRVNSGHKMDLLKKQNYTDTAYKEAVSKLKYLLAESYTPRTSRRIYQDKNIYPRSTSRNRGLLNDIDLQSVISDNTTLPDKNNQQITSILTQIDDSSAPSRELKALIMRQEEYIEQLEQESRYCKDELKNLLCKIRNVVAENELLHDKNKMALLKGFLNDHHDDNDIENNDNKIKNDKKLIQINSLKKIKSRDNLLFDCGSSKIIFESRISELEAQLTQCKIELKNALENNDMNNKNFNDKNIILNRENNDTIDQIIREKCELTNKLDEITKNLQLSREREVDANQKIKNIMENKQQMEYEKNQAEIEIRRLKDELERQRHKIREVGQENCRKLAEERHEVERRYGQQVEQLSADVATHWDVASKSQLEIEKQRREIFDLKRELGQKQATIDDLKKELLSKISNLQNDIYQLTSEKDSLEQELATSKLAADRCERHARQEQSRYQSELNSYKQRIERADADIVHGRRENLRLSEQIASLEKELSMSKMMMRSTDTPSVIISTQSKTGENEMSSLIKNMEAKHEDAVEVADDGATINSMNLHKKKKRTVKVDLKLEIKPKKKSVGFEMVFPLSAQEQMGNLQTNIEYLSTKIRETFAQQQKAQESYVSESDNSSAQIENPSSTTKSLANNERQNSHENNDNTDINNQTNYDQQNNQNYENYPNEYNEQNYSQYEQYDPSMYQENNQEVTNQDVQNSQYDNYQTNDYNVDDNSQIPNQSVTQNDEQQYDNQQK